MRPANSTIQRFNDSTIIIANRQRTKKINTRLLKRITDALLAELKINGAELGINLVAAREMILVNETFLKHEGSTDVITFDYGDVAALVKARKEIFKKTRAFTSAATNLRGELFICVDAAISQAKQFKTNWPSEIVRYTIHGILHLLGHDDLRADLRRKMKREENRLLRLLAKKFSLAQIGGGSKLRA
jgi:probable rRNA maturation factor